MRRLSAGHHHGVLAPKFPRGARHRSVRFRFDRMYNRYSIVRHIPRPMVRTSNEVSDRADQNERSPSRVKRVLRRVAQRPYGTVNGRRQGSELSEGTSDEMFIRRVRSIGIQNRPTSPRSPWQNAYAGQLIGSIRRECVDHIVVFGERHLRRVLLSYMDHHDETRTHLSLNKDAPISRAAEAAGRILCRPILGGLHHQYARA
jgi:hypothetical protein